MNQILDRIKNPKDLKQLKIKDLSRLAKEMRTS
jgi:deoxyxylulose-5-phosphate synthase